MKRLFAWLRRWLAGPPDFEGELARALRRTTATPVESFGASSPRAARSHRNSH